MMATIHNIRAHEAQEAAQFNKCVAQLTALFNRARKNADMLEEFDAALCDFLSDQTHIIARAEEEAKPFSTDWADQRSYFEATR